MATTVGNPTSRPALRGWLVSGIIGTGLLLCAAALTLYYGMAFGTVAIVMAVLVALIPLGIVVPTFLWLDRFEAEPNRYLVFAFLWGALVATLIAMVANTSALAVFQAVTDEDSAMAATAVLVAPLSEESLKGVLILLVLWFRRREFDGVVDGLVYAGMVGAGFAFTENIQYMALAYTDGGPAMLAGIFLGRGILSPFAHPMFTALTGIGVGVAASTRRPLVRVVAPFVGWVAAVVAHASWNLMTFSGSGGVVAGYGLVGVPVFVAFGAFIVWIRRREGSLIGRYLGDYADAGWLSHGEVTMLSSMRLRRDALGWARLTGGAQRLSAMRAFQDCASELGLLRHRMHHSAADAHALETERRLLEALGGLRLEFVGAQARMR